jgi:putative hemolysin
MTPLFILLILFLAAVETLASYISRVYSEFGKILTREIEENLDAWEELVEPQLGLTRGHAEICAAVLQQLTLGIIALEFGALLFDRAPNLARPTLGEIAQAVLAVVLVVVFCNQLLPTLLFNRTEGRWARRLVWPIRLLLWLMTPITVFVRFFYSVASLAEEPVTAEEESEADVEALLEAGEEEGILEESDRELVRSAVEFGDKLVREVMTPRPEVFAVPATLTLEAFLEELREHNFSRVPVYSGSIDNVTGIAFSHDLLQIADTEAGARTVASMAREAEFVPETKRVYELLREMQREKQHMRIVIDEYGGVSGLVTIEDLLEEIVGEIRDEHEEETRHRRAAARTRRRLAGARQLSRRPVAGPLRRVGQPERSRRSLRSHHAGRPGQRDRGPHPAPRRSCPARIRRPAHGDRRLHRPPRRAPARLPAGG